jgi:hypothetical protein
MSHNVAIINISIIKDLQFCLLACPQRRMVMDVVIIDCPAQWGMLLSCKWCAYVGGTLQMDLTYVDIPVKDNIKIRVFREQKMLHNVENPKIGDNDLMYPDIKEPEAEVGDLGNYMLTDNVDPLFLLFQNTSPIKYGLCSLMVLVLTLQLV